MPSKEIFDPSWLGLEGDSRTEKPTATRTTAELSPHHDETLTNITESLECLQEIKITTQTIKSNQQQSLELTKGIHSMLSFFTILAVIGLLLLAVEIFIPIFRK
ncbi:MAG TPA: hypothetical protein VMJ32_06135 [Pirellulales bacterium]|nr:hypothetical protein [Pirellulales bacterium]